MNAVGAYLHTYVDTVQVTLTRLLVCTVCTNPSTVWCVMCVVLYTLYCIFVLCWGVLLDVFIFEMMDGLIVHCTKLYCMYFTVIVLYFACIV